jgi:hypothetical protein
MQYPLIDRELLAHFRLVHAFVNTSVMLLFFYHGWIGLAIRRARMAKETLPFALIKRHRKMGPLLTILGGIGFSIGFTLVLLDTGNVFEYASHFIVGCLIVLLIAATFLMSRRIKGQDSPLRTPHFIIGLAILFFYVIEVFLGIGALL